MERLFGGPLPAAYDFRNVDCRLVTLRSLHQTRDATEQLCSRLTFTAHENLTDRSRSKRPSLANTQVLLNTQVFATSFANRPKLIDLVLLPVLRITEISIGEAVGLEDVLHDLLCLCDGVSLISANGGSRFRLRSSCYGGQVANPTLRSRNVLRTSSTSSGLSW